MSQAMQATQDRWVMAESSDKMWSTEEENNKNFSILALRTHEQYDMAKR